MKYNINSPNELKKLKANKLNELADDIREFLIQSIAQTGGHLASNLGVVELTLALHYVFNSPHDKIIWDVGHQSYVHKMLTGRTNLFNTLRQLNGLSGFPKSHESLHDAFDVGHSSTSISAALGFCIARDLEHKQYKVIAVIGDGAMTGGLAYEALNNAGRQNSNIIVILNDNQMSISENVGAMSKHLNDLRTQPLYLNTKADINNLLMRIPIVGDNIKNIIGKTKDSLKYFILPNVLFEQLGFKYIGPVDGHNVCKLIQVLRTIKKLDGPILLHVKTIKGKGYDKAESAPASFHGVESFDIETGKAIETKIWDTYSDVAGKTITKLADVNKKVVAVTAAMPHGTGLSYFKNKYPERVFDVGIAEAHAVAFSAALAKNQFVPFVCIYSSFLQRAYDQILHDVCIQNLHVVFAIDRAGIVGSDGETHQGLFDLSFLCHIPNMTVLAPKNKFELISMLSFAEQFDGPIAIRYPRGAASRTLREFNSEIVFGKSEIIYRGEKILLISLGSMLDEAVEVRNRLKAVGFNPGLINARFAKPIDCSMFDEFEQYDYVFTFEENVMHGGFGVSVLNELHRRDISCNLHIFAFPDEFIPHGSRVELLDKYHLSAEHMYNEIMRVL